ncbi:hypothetical protein DTO013E5_7425 [Penicillium roqueforti]|uniref:Genomic scaffold, ProqFM164S03 n=1 Tax=Penicillium roqueforti (strain FM164) TaxID=1365484 RepID=W6QH97_PENRF|nr:uncharacterized protein LCP9604111_5080 [Penicillium roqueforti]CDM33574.1 unnamed protein product [Penicillium roqueforti FM164]KAF9248841.1 hypothetical protein LCP9604111_5080 [Penicillium roqueforti]KAI1831719.1 hypothetical protein CBS147337_7529 [Penicillium roqueforti]KAI2681602.1 hypothetical protein CBS147355_2812 [Penicillium roqueforti]KAI2688990.1 hypothetical protein LCP963914a_2079 [Penicillium roqueforti]
MAQAPPMFTPDSEFAELETSPGLKDGGLSLMALARFEFEAGRSNDGTKILMIEWEDDDPTRSAMEGSWHVSWAGKTATMPADERPSDSLRRCYFLLPPYTTIPPIVTLSYEPKPSPTGVPAPKRPQDTFQLNPLPAIFPPALGATGRTAGKKGVLHTIWAKKRLQVLEKEIEDESRNNAEGIALLMAIQEKEWIELNFGIGSRAVDSVDGNHDSANSSSVYPATPVSPVSGRNLSDKLKGLKLQTSDKDLSGGGSHGASLLSPQSPDVAVSSFSSFSSIANSHLHSMPTPNTNPTPTPSSHINLSGPESLKPVALFPPDFLQETQQTSEPTGFTAMDAAMGSITRTPSNDSGEELFAKALSPRSPDLPRSPFSFR